MLLSLIAAKLNFILDHKFLLNNPNFLILITNFRFENRNFVLLDCQFNSQSLLIESLTPPFKFAGLRNHFKIV